MAEVLGGEGVADEVEGGEVGHALGTERGQLGVEAVVTDAAGGEDDAVGGDVVLLVGEDGADGGADVLAEAVLAGDDLDVITTVPRPPAARLVPWLVDTIRFRASTCPSRNGEKRLG